MIILHHEGFPEVGYDKKVTENLPPQYLETLPKLVAIFQSTIHHLEIFRRMMQDFNLDIEVRRNTISSDVTDRAMLQLEYFYYPEKHRQQILYVQKSLF